MAVRRRRRPARDKAWSAARPRNPDICWNSNVAGAKRTSAPKTSRIATAGNAPAPNALRPRAGRLASARAAWADSRRRIQTRCACAITAGSTRVPGGSGDGWTKTWFPITRVRKVGTFSVNGGGAAPDLRQVLIAVPGQVMQPSMILPSPSGPFWCWQTFETAETRPSYLKTATRSPPHDDDARALLGNAVEVANRHIPIGAACASAVSAAARRAPPPCAAP